MFIVASTADNRINRPNWCSLHSHFELGWEVTCAHLDVKHLIATRQINPVNDTVVTLRGREFLYSGLIKTKPWEDFAAERNITDASNFFFDDTWNVCKPYADTSHFDPQIYHHGPEKRYKYEVEDRHLIFNLDTPPVDILANAPFALVCWRYRPTHATDRNSSPETIRAINNELLKKFGRIYLVGHNMEEFCDGNRICHVSLSQFAGLSKRDNCKAVVGAMTGTMQLAAMLTRGKVVVLQHNAFVPNDNECNHPAVLGECLNFNRNERHAFYQPTTPLPQFLPLLGNLI